MVSRPGLVKGYVYRNNTKVAHFKADGDLWITGEFREDQTIT